MKSHEVKEEYVDVCDASAVVVFSVQDGSMRCSGGIVFVSRIIL